MGPEIFTEGHSEKLFVVFLVPLAVFTCHLLNWVAFYGCQQLFCAWKTFILLFASIFALISKASVLKALTKGRVSRKLTSICEILSLHYFFILLSQSSITLAQFIMK